MFIEIAFKARVDKRLCRYFCVNLDFKTSVELNIQSLEREGMNQTLGDTLAANKFILKKS